MHPILNEREAYVAVQEGYIEIRPDGSVWRMFLALRDRHKGGAVNKTKCEPRRCDPMRPNGYRDICVTIERRTFNVLAHRLVFYHFHGPIPDGLTINHKDGVKNNNAPDNLELATYSEQTLHAAHVLHVGPYGKQKGDKAPAAKLTWPQVNEIRDRLLKGESIVPLGDEFGVHNTTISLIKRGKTWRMS